MLWFHNALSQGKKAREIIIEVENWLSHHDVRELLSRSDHSKKGSMNIIPKVV